MKVCSICQRCYSDAAEVCRQDGGDEFVSVGQGDPEMVPGYTLTRRVDVSRTRETYEAEENTSDSPCIVKLFSTSADTDRILSEARTVKSLFNAGVIGVYDTGVIDDGRVFVVSEPAKGQSLRHLLANVGSPDLVASVEIIRQVAEAVHALHDNGITHGAINPENIFLSSDTDGHALIRIDNIDYGRAVEMSITSNKFEIDSHIDALRYFSPEQCTGGERNPRSDVYSVGIVFYELLAGAPPFNSTKAVELIEKHMHERPPELRINNFDLRMLVTHALAESLQKQPSFRQSSANAFARQLRHIEQLATHTSTPPPAVKTAAQVVSNTTASPPSVKIYETIPATIVRKETVEIEAPAVVVIPEVTHIEPPISRADVPAVERADIPPLEMAIEPVVKAAVENEAVTTLPKRSRLRSLKRKLNALSAMVASTMERAEVPSITAVQTPAEMIERPPRKIAWVQPEDDIPSVEEVVKALAADGISEADVVHEPAMPNVKRSKGALLTLDLASSVVREAEVPVKVVDAPTPLIPTPAESRKIELPEPVIAKPVALKPEVVTAPPSKPAPPKPKVVTPPPVVQAKKVQSRPVVAVQPKPFVVTIAQYADTDEEITLVRPPKSRVTIDLEKPRTIYRARTAYARSVDDIAFQPTMIGERKPKASRVPLPEVQDGMFSAHFGASSARSDLKYRAMTIGVGCLVLAALFLFANDSASRFFQSVSPGDSVTAQATSTEVPVPAKVAVIPTKSKSAPRNTNETTVVEPKRDKKAEENKPSAKTPNEKVTPKVTQQSRSVAVPEKVSKRFEPEAPKKQPVTRPAFPDLGRPSGATRPRIVSNPPR